MTATDYIYYLTTALNYNRMTEYTIEVCNRVLYRLDKTHTWRIEHKYDNLNIEDDVDLLASAIFVAYGEYGTSARWGWIVDNSYELAIKSALIRRIKELANAYMMEELAEQHRRDANDT